MQYLLTFLFFITINSNFVFADGMKPEVHRLSNALKYKTVSELVTTGKYDSEFVGFHKFIKASFPNVFKKLKSKSISNTIILEWTGSNSTLKPVLFLAHQDVVPVDEVDVNKWSVDPFSGSIQNGIIWGRGALDDKSSMLGILEAVEKLLINNINPVRTLYFSFGHDEEIGGKNGQKQAAQWFLDRGIKFDSVFDEGLTTIEDLFPEIKRPVALIGIAEKGYVTFRLTTQSKGGHSSLPSKDNVIIKLTSALQEINRNQLSKTIHPIAEQFFKIIGKEIGGIKGFVLQHPKLFSPLLIYLSNKEPTSAALLGTTTAVTMIHSGVKDNIIPNEAVAYINFRLLPGQSSDEILKHLQNIISNNSVKIEKLTETESPAVETSSVQSEVYQDLKTSIEGIYSNVIVVPSLVLGSTDSKHYREITDNIYRYAPFKILKKDLNQIHGIDEKISVDNYLQMIEFYNTFIHKIAIKN